MTGGLGGVRVGCIEPVHKANEQNEHVSLYTLGIICIY